MKIADEEMELVIQRVRSQVSRVLVLNGPNPFVIRLAISIIRMVVLQRPIIEKNIESCDDHTP